MSSVARSSMTEFDLVLVGGGLQNGLIALHALHTHPSARIALIEPQPRLGGNHTWCVHAGDVPPAAASWFEALVVRRWESYDVRFPGFERSLALPYAVVSSDRFNDVLRAAFARSADSVLAIGRRASNIAARQVELDDGSILRGNLVIDARGPDASAFAGACGYQKFVGLELRGDRPHGVLRPILMDATCPQHDGFRFFYVLPLSADRLLVEDTRFALSAKLDVAEASAAVLAYASRFAGEWTLVRSEQGVLPMPWSGNEHARAWTSPLLAGYRGGYFHPATGYSMPAALRVAQYIGDTLLGGAAQRDWHVLETQHRAQVAYAQHLNRLLFTGFEEHAMWQVFARFYRFPEALISRFYAMSLGSLDRARILIGRPPRGFSVLRSLRSLRAARSGALS
jgi:lycopene beta-cyclase